MKSFEFDAEIKQNNNNKSCFVEFPYDVKQEFGTNGQVKVVAFFDGCEYKGSLVKMRHHYHCIGLTKEIRKKINKEVSDKVHAVITKDNSARIVEIPEDFLKPLNENQKSKLFFNNLSYTNQKEYVKWITGSKKTETRSKRIANSILMLSREIKHP